MKRYARRLTLMGILLILLTPCARAEDQASRSPEESLRERVKGLAKLSNVDRRTHVDDFFELAELCAENRKDDEAIDFYEQGLRLDPWRLEHQLGLARIFKKIGLTDQAIEKARIVYRYAEVEDAIDRAEAMLVDLDAGEAPVTSSKVPQVDTRTTIVIVPIGKLNTRVLSEVADALEQRLKIRFSVCENTLAPGDADRSYVDTHLPAMVDAIRADMSRRAVRSILAELDLTEASLDDIDAQVRFIGAVMRWSGRTPAEMRAFYDRVEEIRQAGQHDAKRLLAKLIRSHPLDRTGDIVGYLGITEHDIFAKDYNFLYGWGREGHAVMSYQRFTSVFNGEPPNRPRLIERATKQAISSSFFILGIPRCTSPLCARAYPHNLTEHDQKTSQLCEGCKRHLEWTLAKHR